MAIISNIRKRQGFIIFILALALFAFILTGLFTGKSGMFGGPSTTLGKVNGEKIDIQDFNKAEGALGSSGDYYGKRNALWNYFVEEAIVNQEAKALGLGVSNEELLDLEFGTNLSPIITSRFQNPNTRQPDREQLNSIKQAIIDGNLNPQYTAFWKHQEKEIRKSRLQEKIKNMVEKALYVPTFMKEQGNKEQFSKVSFAFVKVPFSAISDNDVQVSDDDLNNYLNEHKKEFVKEEEYRTIKFATFNVYPTQQDSLTIFNSMKDLADDFISTANDTMFTNNNGGVFPTAYQKKAELSSVYADNIFDAEPGAVYGPFQDGDSYMVVKMIDRIIIPDSVKSRHILISGKTQQEAAAAYQKLDSLKTVIEEGKASFEELAKVYGQDGTASKGGDLGYAAIGQMVKPFNDLIFYNAKINELNIILTQFGVHLVEVLDRKYETKEEGVKLASIRKTIVPSDDTQSKRYTEVNNFLLTNKEDVNKLEAALAERNDVTVQTSNPVTENDYIINGLEKGQTTRDMIKWAFKASERDVSPIVYNFEDKVNYYTSKYVISWLNSIQPAGQVDLESMRDQVMKLVLDEKKAAKASEAFVDLQSFASKYSAKVDTAMNVGFASPYTPALGSEPGLVGKAFQLNSGDVIPPFQGVGAIYAAQIINKSETDSKNLAGVKNFGLDNMKTNVTATLMRYMKEASKIEDKRNTFF